jgi:hypothetical protein
MRPCVSRQFSYHSKLLDKDTPGNVVLVAYCPSSGRIRRDNGRRPYIEGDWLGDRRGGDTEYTEGDKEGWERNHVGRGWRNDDRATEGVECSRRAQRRKEGVEKKTHNRCKFKGRSWM